MLRTWMQFLVAASLAGFAAGIGSAPITAGPATPGPAQIAAAPNYQGLWWNSPPGSESGWGLNLAHQGDVIYATWFTYDHAGKGWWLVMAARRTAPGSYTGTLYEAAGPAFSAVPFDPAKVTGGPVGEGTLAFTDLDNGTLRATVKGAAQVKFITRQAFGPLPTCTYGAQPDFAAATNYQDLWWVRDGAESGWGVSLAHEGDNIFATWFTYDVDGTPMWLAVTAAKSSPGVYGGQLFRTTGPAYDATPFDTTKVTRTFVGAATFTFTDGNAATFAYTVNGVSQSKAITRELFAAPAGTVCGAPYRDMAPVHAVVAADIAQCSGAPAAQSGAAKTAALITPQDALVLTAGDNVYEEGTAAEFANCFDPTWGAFKDRIYPTIGNHEHVTPDAAAYFDYFGARAGPDRRGYYSFDYAGWHFISLDSAIDFAPQSEQHRWLVADLAASRDSLCTIALWHYPAFNSGAQYGSVLSMRPLFDVLHDAGVEMVFSGHDHLYERFAPQRADGTVDPARGVRQFVVGTGGHSLNPFGTPLPNSEFRYNQSWGVVRLTLGQGSYGWQFVPVGGGAPIDIGSANCHP